MKRIRLFSLEKHAAPYEKWPSRTRLLRNGQPTRTRVPGYCLLRQYELPGPRYLLVTDVDCPWEEETYVLLLDASLRQVSKVRFAFPWGFYSLDEATVVDERTVELVFGVQGIWRVSVLNERRWVFGSFLGARKVGSHCCFECRPQAEGQATQTGQKAKLSVKRRRSWCWARLPVYAVLDGEDLGTLSNGEQEQFDITSGSHVFVATTWSGFRSNHLALEVLPGETIQLEVAPTGSFWNPDELGLRCAILRNETVP